MISPNYTIPITTVSKERYERVAERYERVRIGWHCAKVKGHAELKIERSRVKTLSYDFPKLHHSNPNSFRANVHLDQIKKKGLGHSKVT